MSSSLLITCAEGGNAMCNVLAKKPFEISCGILREVRRCILQGIHAPNWDWQHHVAGVQTLPTLGNTQVFFKQPKVSHNS